MCYTGASPACCSQEGGRAAAFRVQHRSCRGRAKKARAQAVAIATKAAPPPPVKSSRAALVVSLAVFLAVLVVYLYTLQSTVVSRKDNGEMVSAAHVLGIIHPTGYPLWTMLARLFDFCRWAIPARIGWPCFRRCRWRACRAIITWLVIALSGSLLAGPFAGLLFAFWLPTWNEAVIAESYGPQALLVTLFLLALWLWEGKRAPCALMWVSARRRDSRRVITGPVC